jgi:predicted anti-sigma-YlaC factor YlaD
MRCKQAYRFICENIDQDLNSPRCRQIKKHLDACPECRAYLESLQGTVRLYKKRPLPAVPSSAHRQLIKAIDIAWTSSPVKRRSHKSRGQDTFTGRKD